MMDSLMPWFVFKYSINCAEFRIVFEAFWKSGVLSKSLSGLILLFKSLYSSNTFARIYTVRVGKMGVPKFFVENRLWRKPLQSKKSSSTKTIFFDEDNFRRKISVPKGGPYLLFHFVILLGWIAKLFANFFLRTVLWKTIKKNSQFQFRTEDNN